MKKSKFVFIAEVTATIVVFIATLTAIIGMKILKTESKNSDEDILKLIEQAQIEQVEKGYEIVDSNDKEARQVRIKEEDGTER